MINSQAQTHSATTKSTGLLFILILSALMAVTSLSTDIYLPAMPVMAKDLQGNAELTITGFLIGFCIAQLIWGPISDRYGRRLPLFIGLSLFVIGSIGCALSTDIVQIVFWRVFQALGACTGPMLARAMIRDLFSRTRAAQMLSTLMVIMAIAPIAAVEFQSSILEVDAVIHAINDMVERLTATLERERLFTADVAHELRTPLAGLRLHLELIARQQNIDMSALILRLDQMTDSVSQLLQLARIGQSFDAGSYQQVHLVTDVTTPLRDSLLTMIKLRHQQLVLPENTADFVVKGDPTLLQLVVRNLVENAHRYSPQHSTLRVSVQQVAAVKHIG